MTIVPFHPLQWSKQTILSIGFCSPSQAERFAIAVCRELGLGEFSANTNTPILWDDSIPLRDRPLSASLRAGGKDHVPHTKHKHIKTGLSKPLQNDEKRTASCTVSS